MSVMRGGAPVAGLTAADFALTDNGAAQEVQSVTLEQLPLSVTLVLDTSQSVAGERLRHLVQAGEGLTAALRPEDRAALVTFSHAVDLRVPMTGDMASIRAALGAMAGNGATSLRDAVTWPLQLQPCTIRTRPLVLVFTDGHDTASWLTEDAVIDSARRAGVVIHAVRVESDALLDRRANLPAGEHGRRPPDQAAVQGAFDEGAPDDDAPRADRPSEMNLRDAAPTSRPPGFRAGMVSASAPGPQEPLKKKRRSTGGAPTADPGILRALCALRSTCISFALRRTLETSFARFNATSNAS